jgi:hypothetical protein
LGSRWACRITSVVTRHHTPLPFHTYCHAFSRCCRKAVSTRLSARRLSLRAQRRPGLLGGRLLLVFLESSRLGSWLDIESLASICCVCDMLGKSALFRSDERGCRSRRSRSLTTLLAVGGPMLHHSQNSDKVPEPAHRIPPTMHHIEQAMLSEIDARALADQVRAIEGHNMCKQCLCGIQ